MKTGFRLDGQVALVTGGASGIGRATAIALAEAGASVAVTDLDGPAAERVAADLTARGKQAIGRLLDVTDERAVGAVTEAVASEFKRLDVLVNSAGIGARGASETLALETWNKVVAVNLTGTFLCAREAGRRMLDQGHGSIVNIASIMGLVGGGLYPHSAYHASKGAVVNLTRALAVEWGRHGVRVNAIAPTFVETPLTERLLTDHEIRRSILQLTPLGKLATVDDVAAAAVYLASPAAAMVTGHILAVDGGWLAR